MVAIDELLSVWEERQEQGVPITPEELCRNCPDLLNEVRWHIRALEAVESCFGTAENDAAATDGVQQALPPDPLREGPVRVSTEYRIERLHASGGLGHVFLATDPILNRKVAIKFPRSGRITAEQRVRFEREARITARLDHPGIVPVHSLKQDDPRRPCYVMQFVEGPTLQEAVEQLHQTAPGTKTANFYHSLPVRKLLTSFVSLCNIVAYAHGQKVIHRDIKPGNVMLGPFGETLLLDWGLAKVLGEWEAPPEAESNEAPRGQRMSSPASSSSTRTGSAMGTPAFASPEQLLGKTAEVDERSDVFSLGATLFFLLTGQIHVDLNSPSEQLVQASGGRSATPRDRVPAVPARLNAICRHAMANDPGQRYPGVSELTADLERYLGGEAVSVHRDAWPVRLGRWLRRRPVFAAATGATVLMAIVAGSLGSLLLGSKNRELSQSNSRLVVAMDESRAANQQALEALRSLVDDVVIRDLSEMKTVDGSERAFLNRIFEQYSALAELGGESYASRAIRAEGLMQMGKIQLRLSDETEALARLEAAVAQFQKLVDESDEPGPRLQLAETLAELGQTLLRLGRLDQARERTQAGIDLLESTQPGAEAQRRSLPVLAGLYRVLGNVQQGQRQWNEARKSLDESRQRLESLVKSDGDSASHRQTLAAVYRHLGETSAQLGDLGHQVQYSERALELQRELVQQFPDQPEHELGLALACINSSRHRETAGQISAAVEELNEAISVSDKLSGRFPAVARYRETLAGSHARRGNLEWRQDNPEPAEDDLGKAISQFRQLIADFPEVPDYREGLMRTRLALANIKLDRNRFPAGDRIFLDLFADWKKFSRALPEVAARSMTLAMARSDYSRVQRRQSRAQDAVQPLEEALALFGDFARNDSSSTPVWWQARTAIALGHCLLDQKPEESISRYSAAAASFAGLAKQYPGDFDLLSRLATAHRELAAGFASAGKPDEAALHRQRELDLRVQVVDGSPSNPYYRVLYARSLMEQGDDVRRARDLPAAMDLYNRAVTVITEALEQHPDDRLVRMTMGDLRASEGRVLFLFQDFAGAELKFAEAVELNPSLQNRASRANNLSRFRPEGVLEQVDAVLADRIPDTIPLKSLMVACGTAANSVADPALRDQLGDRMVKILQHMVDDDYLPASGTLGELQTSPTYAVFRERADYQQLLERLVARNKNLAEPEFIRRLPAGLQPLSRWAASRSIYDWSPGMWLYRAFGAGEESGR